MAQGDASSQEPVQALRAVNKNLPLSSISPAKPDDIFYAECHIDPATQNPIVLWDDILQLFANAVLVRSKAKALPFLKDPEPRRIAASPDSILDVIVDGPMTDVEKTLSQAPITPPGKTLPQAPITPPSVKRNPEYENVEVTMENFRHMEIPISTLARGPQIVLNDKLPATEKNRPTTRVNISNSPQSQYSEESNAAASDEELLAQKIIKASHGDENAQTELGDMYKGGSGDFKQNYQKAMNWYLKAAIQGNAKAQYSIGIMYQDGLGVQQDYTTAMIWYQKAASRGHAGAQCNIGCMYDSGQGAQLDHVAALTWFHKSADQGYAHALYNIGVSYMNGQGVPRDSAKGMTWLHKAAIQGDADLQYGLGTIYEKGRRDLPKDIFKAKMWYQRAADQNYEPAIRKLSSLE
ncbi:hypothetical protein FBU30_006986 [Linnemannia zychae]|nr:hypothetical protein FBU30_006986 [Linnemannia zychae]